MLYELFIEGKKADLSEDVEICLSYTAVDTEKPEATHGGYSKSVDLQGTETNNNIFGQLYDLDRTILEDAEGSIGAYFDPKRRTNYVLWYNGDIVDRGYLKVDNVLKEDGNITYSLTLYSDLGDFFYNLMYDKETGKELTLADLHYGFIDNDDNQIDEDNEPLMNWDKDYIYESWSVLENLSGEDGKYLENCITAAPVYGGYYDDFDNNKVLINYDSLPPKVGNVSTNWPISQQILNPAMTADTSYTAYKGWVLAEATRDLDEWEVRDLRVSCQRPAVKMSVILNAISQPENNGGYEVIWDEEIKNSPYFNKTYLVLNKVDFDLVKDYIDAGYLNAVLMQIPCVNGAGFYSANLYDTTSHETTFNLSNATNPKLKLAFNSVINHQTSNQSDVLVTSYMHQRGFFGYIYGGQAVRATAWKNGSIVAKTLTYIQTTAPYDIPQGWGYKMNNWRTQMANKLGVPENDIVIIENTIVRNGEGIYGWQNLLALEMNLPKEDGIEIKIETCWVFLNTETDPRYQVGIASVRYDQVWLFGTSYKATSDVELLNNNEEFSGIQDDENNDEKQETRLPKRVLFAETDSPYKYLIGFTRMFGAKYRYDLSTKKIYINKRENYYLPVAYDINKWIDRKQSIEINPTLAEYKWYTYGFLTPETYAAILYGRKNTYEYGQAKIDTGYYFNNEEHNVFEDIPYTNAIPFLQKSLYYTIYDGVPAVLNSPTLTVSTFKQTGTTLEDKDTKVYGYTRSHSAVIETDGAGNKLCCFSDDNDGVNDLTNCLVFYDGMKNTVDNYQLSDNIPMMQYLNEKPCFMFVSGGTTAYAGPNSVNKESVCKVVNKIPIFSKYLTNENGVYTDSLDFVKPNYTFIGNESNYQGGICIFDRYWRGYIEDLYDPDAKSVTLKMFLKEQPDEAMRKFYLFDNSIWVISEITDYDISSEEPTQVKFVLVRDYHNYINDELQWNNLYN